MSTFELAIPTILRQEGAYNNDSRDPGGATNYGISLRFLKSIGAIDGDIDLDGDVDIDDIQKMKPANASMLYKKYWWDKYGYQKINSQIIATKILSLSVNMGAIQSHKCVQRAIRAATAIKLVEDGILGSITFSAINTARDEILLSALKSEAAGFYRLLNKPHYLKGWLNRAYE